MAKADVVVSNHGSIVILHFLTPAARDWREEHLPTDAHPWGRIIAWDDVSAESEMEHHFRGPFHGHDDVTTHVVNR